MALQRQAININFSQGIDEKTDPFQLPIGKFVSLQNSVFNKAGQLTKRNGYRRLTPTITSTSASISSISDSPSTYLTTFNGNLTALGPSLLAYSSGTNSWSNKGPLETVNLSTLPLVRNSTNQAQADAVVSGNGLVCVAYQDQTLSSLSTPIYKYAVLDSTTGQYIINPTTLTSADATYGNPRVVLLDSYFVILYTVHPASYGIKYIAISINDPTQITAPADIVTSYIPASTVNFDALVVNSKLFVAYNTTAGGQSVKVTYITSTLSTPVTPVTFSGEIATMFSMTADITTPSDPVIYVSYYDLASTTGKVVAIDDSLNKILNPATFVSSGTIKNLASTATHGVLTVYYEVSATYGYDGSIATNYIASKTVTVAGSVSSASTIVRSVGLASKAFRINSKSYFLGIYSSTYQPTYFLINSSGNVISKLAYANAGPYYTKGLPGISMNGDTVQIPYLYKDLVQAVNKTQGVSNSAGVYAQTGVNLVSFEFSSSNILTAEIGKNLNITGGFLGMYDGVAPVEQGFFLYPDYIEATANSSGGSMIQQQYYYQVTYEWADNQGNIFRSAPSIPLGVNLSVGGGSGSVTLHIPTLRLTYKTSIPVKIVVYRWSTAQQSYYQVSSVSSPTLNSTTVDYIDYTDTASDSTIAGNNLIYTTGGVLENIAAPGTENMCLFNNRLWLVDAENRNLLWFSKQVIEATPVEMTDLLTLYVAPTTSAQGSTGSITAIAPMDDKLIVFKRNALGYINGVGPDNSGANNQYSDFTLITSVVGCTNQQSIVFMPQGLMFQSSKGIWLLGRDLSTQYIGAAVESLTEGATVESAVNVPGTTQVRFTLDTGVTLMYDYYFGQWGTFTNIPAVSSTIYSNLHTYLNREGDVFTESPGEYLDYTTPVLMSFQTGWLNFAGVQGYERFYSLYLLGVYLTPFKLNTQIAYNYNSAALQATIITPDNQTVPYGDGTLWGGDPTWGGTASVGLEATANVFEARLFPQIQKCESFQITMNEVYDPSYGQQPGEGLTLSGMNLVVGLKKGYRTSRAGRNFG